MNTTTVVVHAASVNSSIKCKFANIFEKRIIEEKVLNYMRTKKNCK